MSSSWHTVNIYIYKKLAVYWLKLTKLPKALEKHSGDVQTKDQTLNWHNHTPCEAELKTTTSRLTLILLTCRIWWAPNNASRWQMEFNWEFKGLTTALGVRIDMIWYDMIRYDIYVLTSTGLTLGGSSTVHIYTQTIHTTAQWKRIPRTEYT